MGTHTQSIHSNQIIPNKAKPWLDEFGSLLTSAQLKKHSESWSHEVWEEYLRTIESPLSESQLSPSNFDELAEMQTENIFSFSELCADDDLKAQIKIMLNVLTKKQKRVMEMIYWENKSERQIATILKIHQTSVRDFKRSALKRLSATYCLPLTSPLMRGKISFLDKTGGEDAKATLTVAKSNSYEEVRP